MEGYEKVILAGAIVVMMIALFFAVILTAEETKRLRRADKIINEKVNRMVRNTDWLPVPLQEYIEEDAKEAELTKEIWEALFNGEKIED